MNYSVLKHNEEFWDWIPRLHTLYFEYTYVNKSSELLKLLHYLRPLVIDISNVSLFELEIEAGLRPYSANKLMIWVDHLKKGLEMITPSQQLVVDLYRRSTLKNEEIRLIESLPIL